MTEHVGTFLELGGGPESQGKVAGGQLLSKAAYGAGGPRGAQGAPSTPDFGLWLVLPEESETQLGLRSLNSLACYSAL